MAERQRKQPAVGERRILIVEDESVVALDLAHSLRDMGFKVTDIVARGDDALHSALQNRPDAVLLDIRLEGNQDGIEAAAQLRAHIQVPIVYLTAHADEQTLSRALHTEPCGYLLKPFNPDQLEQLIEKALERRR